MCEHNRTKTTDKCYMGPVGPADKHNPAAHGGITEETRCLDCGSVRRSNVNFCHVEEGEWYEDELSAAYRADRHREQLDELARKGIW